MPGSSNPALDRASSRVESAPAAARRVAETALRLLDSHGLDEPLPRARSGLLAGVVAARTGASHEAVPHSEEILHAPPAQGTEWVRLAALVDCGGELSDGPFTLSDPERACAGGRAPSVVFLSSWESAAADPRLADAPTPATAFLGAGSRVAIGALWEVPDGVAARMARSRYENLPGRTPVEALSAARTRLPENHGPAFTLHGWSTGRPPPA